MGAFSQGITLCLNEFSKSLTNKAYTWYANLKPRSKREFEHLVSLFNSKFFCADAKFSLFQTQPHTSAPRGSLGHLCEKIPWQNSLLCDLVEEMMLVDVCLHGMTEEYCIFVENLSFSSFTKLMEAAHRTNQKVRPSSASRSSSNSSSWKKSLVATLRREKNPDHLN